jgi:hypothetical protein
MKFRTILTGTLALLLSAAAFAATDVNGKWTAEIAGRNGQARTSTFTFKADGDKLTGTVAGGQGGETAIADGKISGDDITFTVTRERQGNTIKTSYMGKVSGDEIKMKAKMEGGEGREQEFTAKRAK